ncbi:hypothetical protein PINS_up015704 [Pythium insidiosum]|nr:hypothetical protein PINS_up015704 [Pythium insidiosum]
MNGQRRSVLSATGEMSGEEAAALNRTIGDAAVRYFDLAQQRERNYKFLFENVLHLKGNTGVYLLYASARLAWHPSEGTYAKRCSVCHRLGCRLAPGGLD